jgi:hypothetical protein
MEKTLNASRDDRLHRGRKVTLAFSMQGWGQFLLQGFLIAALYISNGLNAGPVFALPGVEFVFRGTYGSAAVGTWLLAWWRFFCNRQASDYDTQKDLRGSSYSLAAFKGLSKHFWHRLLGTSMAWFANDVFFYANKLYQAQFIGVIAGEHAKGDVMVLWKWGLLNCFVSLLGYILASVMVDMKFYGRKWMMINGFMACFAVIASPLCEFGWFTSGTGIRLFMAFYFLSSFFNQFGPNCVTFLVAGEVFPADVRSTAHGISAFIGKAGVLLVCLVKMRLNIEHMFWFVAFWGLVGAILTWLFIPDTTGLDLREQERRWDCLKGGKVYRGIAVNKTHLSRYERRIGIDKTYDPVGDVEDHVEYLREKFLAQEEANKNAGEDRIPPGIVFTPGQCAYFLATSNVESSESSSSSTLAYFNRKTTVEKDLGDAQ